MNSEQSPQPNIPPLCANGCGFYGNPTTRNLCSKCYRDVVRQEQEEAHPKQPQQGFVSSIQGSTLVSSFSSNNTQASFVQAKSSSQSDLDNEITLKSDAPRECLEVKTTGGCSTADCNDTLNASDTTILNPPEDKKKCWKCGRKVGLLGFPCRCEHYFCGEHRPAIKHDCEFDYKSYDRKHLKRVNPKVVADKINKI